MSYRISAISSRTFYWTLLNLAQTSFVQSVLIKRSTASRERWDQYQLARVSRVTACYINWIEKEMYRKEIDNELITRGLLQRICSGRWTNLPWSSDRIETRGFFKRQSNSWASRSHFISLHQLRCILLLRRDAFIASWTKKRTDLSNEFRPINLFVWRIISLRRFHKHQLNRS